MNFTTTLRSGLFSSMATVLAMTAPLASAATITLADGTVLEGELGPPVTVSIITSAGAHAQNVPFAQLPAELQARYWKSPAAAAVMKTGPVTNDEIVALATSVNFKTWAQVTAVPSFRDRPEKRGPGGLVVTPAFNAIAENWASVYPAGHALAIPVPVAPAPPIQPTWQEPLARAKALLARSTQGLQKYWLEDFVLAAEAIAKKDSAAFAAQFRSLKESRLSDKMR